MMRKCEKCQLNYDDVYRWTLCPHDKFAASESAKQLLRETGHPVEEPASSKPFSDRSHDWPPRETAVGLANGVRRRGSTGQLFEVRSGQWTRVFGAPSGERPEEGDDDTAADTE